MYEITVALKYLLPRLRQLSVSVISIISIFVIAVVVWLSIVFFSAQEAIERRWTEKMVALTAPVRLIPQQAYYTSYYYQIDEFSQESQYRLKTFAEKLKSVKTDPYLPENDPPLPEFFPAPLRNSRGEIIDIIKETKNAVDSIQGIPGISCYPFESTVTNIQLKLIRNTPQNQEVTETIRQSSYLVNLDPHNSRLKDALIPLRNIDVQNIFATLLRISQSSSKNQIKAAALLNEFLECVHPKTFTVSQGGWEIPRQLIPENKQIQALALFKNNDITCIYITNDTACIKGQKESAITSFGTIQKVGNTLYFSSQSKKQEIQQHIPCIALPGSTLTFKSNLPNINAPSLVHPILQLHLGDITLHTPLDFGIFSLDSFEIQPTENISKFFVTQDHLGNFHLPTNELLGNGCLMPQSYIEAGAQLFDAGNLLYQSLQATSVHEMKLPCFIAGFYDPGIIPIGGRLILAPEEIVEVVLSSMGDDKLLPTGLNVNINQLSDANKAKSLIQKALQEKGLSNFWTVQSYEDYEFTRDIFMQMKSDRNLFSLISVIITIVACSNIVSMLIILVHDKRKEIAILRAIGASRISVGCIFGLSGLIMGTLGSVIGSILAYFTLKNLQGLLSFISSVQGFELLNSNFYGNIVTAEFSLTSALFVILATAIGSMVAGIVPAVKAAFTNTSDALRNE